MKKWYNLFVSVGDSAEQPEADSSGNPPPAAAAQAVAEIAASVAPAPKFTATVENPTSFQEIYDAAEIQSPAHGFTVMKVGDMLRSEHIRNMPRDVKRGSVLVALEAAGAPVQDVIQDAVKRDRALDTFEHVQEKALHDLEAKVTTENQQVEAEMNKVMADYRAKLQANNEKVAREKERFYAWRLKKQEEEQKIADTVSYFVTENPIKPGGPAAPPAPSQTPGQQPQ